jgi:hypothetical protein
LERVREREREREREEERKRQTVGTSQRTPDANPSCAELLLTPWVT